MLRHRPTVALADDAESTRLLYRMHVESDGRFDVCKKDASNGVEAVNLVRSCDPDLILLDISMPVMDGLTAASMIRHENNHVKIVVLSGEMTPELEKRCVEIGVDAYFRKGTDLDGILDTMVTLLAT